MSKALEFALTPLLLAQALALRRRALVLPEAGGPRSGRLGGGAPLLRLMIAGDSSAAGVGVDHQDRALAGFLVEALLRRLGGALHWSLHAASGLSTERVHALLRQVPPEPADVALIVCGVNDLIERVPHDAALAHRQALADWLLQSRGVGHVVFAQLPPIDRFPLLPQPLRYMAGVEAWRHDEAVAQWSAGMRNVSHARFPVDVDARTMAEDGFHPAEPLYRQCGEGLAEHIAAVVRGAVRAEAGGPALSPAGSAWAGLAGRSRQK